MSSIVEPVPSNAISRNDTKEPGSNVETPGASLKDGSQSGKRFLRLGSSLRKLPAMREWDQNGDGILSEEELISAAVAHSRLQILLYSYKRLALALAIFMLLQVGGMVAAVVIGVLAVRDTKVKDGRLTTTSGNVLGVNQAYGFNSLRSLYNTTWTELHDIRFVTVYVPALQKVKSFRVEEVDRNSTTLMLTSPLDTKLIVTEFNVFFITREGASYEVETTPATTGSGHGRRLSSITATDILSSLAGLSGGTSTLARAFAPPCCP